MSSLPDEIRQSLQSCWSLEVSEFCQTDFPSFQPPPIPSVSTDMKTAASSCSATENAQLRTFHHSAERSKCASDFEPISSYDEMGPRFSYDNAIGFNAHQMPTTSRNVPYNCLKLGIQQNCQQFPTMLPRRVDCRLPYFHPLRYQPRSYYPYQFVTTFNSVRFNSEPFYHDKQCDFSAYLKRYLVNAHVQNTRSPFSAQSPSTAILNDKCMREQHHSQILNVNSASTLENNHLSISRPNANNKNFAAGILDPQINCDLTRRTRAKLVKRLLKKPKKPIKEQTLKMRAYYRKINKLLSHDLFSLPLCPNDFSPLPRARVNSSVASSAVRLRKLMGFYNYNPRCLFFDKAVDRFLNNSSEYLLNARLNRLLSISDQTTEIPLWNGSNETLDSVLKRLESNTPQPMCDCNCLPKDQLSSETEGPYYTHLAAAPTIVALRAIIEERCGISGSALRIEKLHFTSSEGRTFYGCPIAKWILRRSNLDEKILCLVRPRQGHFCATAILCIGLVAWEGVDDYRANDLYAYLTEVLPEKGNVTNRRCELNEKRNCACQGVDEGTCGASFSFGCSWSMYYNGCKFARSSPAVKFKLKPHANADQKILEDKFHALADVVAPLYRRLAPAAYRNQTFYSMQAQSCRLGHGPGGPFSGVTACCDFCAHAHKDIHNMNNGCTIVVTLTKHAGFDKIDDEQLHVLPNYLLNEADEFGNERRSAQNGVEFLTKYPSHMRYRTQKAVSCRQRALRQKNKARILLTTNSTSEQTSNAAVIPADQINQYYYAYTENESAFADSSVGGVAIALTHGSVFFEVAKKENHATTALKWPDRRHPKRISLVFYQHKLLNEPEHGSDAWRRLQEHNKRYGLRGTSVSTLAIDRSRSATDQSESVIDRSKSAIDQSKSAIYRSQSVVDQSKSGIDQSKFVIDQSVSIDRKNSLRSDQSDRCVANLPKNAFRGESKETLPRGASCDNLHVTTPTKWSFGTQNNCTVSTVDALSMSECRLNGKHNHSSV